MGVGRVAEALVDDDGPERVHVEALLVALDHDAELVGLDDALEGRAAQDAPEARGEAVELRRDAPPEAPVDEGLDVGVAVVGGDGDGGPAGDEVHEGAVRRGRQRIRVDERPAERVLDVLAGLEGQEHAQALGEVLVELREVLEGVARAGVVVEPGRVRRGRRRQQLLVGDAREADLEDDRVVDGQADEEPRELEFRVVPGARDGWTLSGLDGRSVSRRARSL